jgi:uncharacterized protein
MKYLLVLVVVWVGYHFWRNARRAQELADQEREGRPNAGPVTMVVCRHCGTHLPTSEAIAHGRDFYCSAEHRDQHAV